MAFRVPWPVKAGDHESITFVWPGTLGAESYRCEVRAEPGAPGASLATATCSVVAVGDNVEVTASLTSAQTRALALNVVAYDLQQDAAGVLTTLFEGPMSISRDVTL